MQSHKLHVLGLKQWLIGFAYLKPNFATNIKFDLPMLGIVLRFIIRGNNIYSQLSIFLKMFLGKLNVYGLEGKVKACQSINRSRDLKSKQKFIGARIKHARVSSI